MSFLNGPKNPREELVLRIRCTTCPICGCQVTATGIGILRHWEAGISWDRDDLREKYMAPHGTIELLSFASWSKWSWQPSSLWGTSFKTQVGSSFNLSSPSTFTSCQLNPEATRKCGLGSLGRESTASTKNCKIYYNQLSCMHVCGMAYL